MQSVALERALAIRLKNEGAVFERGGQREEESRRTLHRDLGELDTAERYAREALAVAEKLFPANHPFVADTLASLGPVAQKRGDRAGARALYERSIASYEASAPARMIRASRTRCATLRRCCGRGRDERGCASLRARAGPEAQGVRRPPSRSRRVLVTTWRAVVWPLGDLRGRSRRSARVSTCSARLLPDSPQLAGGLFLLGDVLRRNHRPDEALPYLEEAHAIWRKNPGRNPGDLADLEATIATTRAALR